MEKNLAFRAGMLCLLLSFVTLHTDLPAQSVQPPAGATTKTKTTVRKKSTAKDVPAPVTATTAGQSSKSHKKTTSNQPTGTVTAAKPAKTTAKSAGSRSTKKGASAQPAPNNEPVVQGASSASAPTAPAKRAKKTKQPVSADTGVAASTGLKSTAAKPTTKTKGLQAQPSATTDKATGETYNGHTLYTGPRGGRYYINANGHKEYVKRSQ